MENIKNIKIRDFDYSLPDYKIAKYPLKKRDESKLLISRNGILQQDFFKNISHHLPANSLLVSNNTKVIRARMEFFKETGARIEIFCIEPYLPKNYDSNFATNNTCLWLCAVGNLKKWKTGVLSRQIIKNKQTTTLEIEKKRNIGELQLIEFKWNNTQITFADIIEHLGHIPIPPYLNRKEEKSDLLNYQTIYSKQKGSVAAPTAGLHFTEEVFQTLKDKQITWHEVTLHVGAGTFKPVKDEEIGTHIMHYEAFVILKKNLLTLLKFKKNITAVGTTTVRTLESIYWLGVKLRCQKLTNKNDWTLHQWEAYELPQTIGVEEALQAIYDYMEKEKIEFINAYTGIMIVPSYEFKIIQRLITNFHQPKSTLLLLISALLGKDWKNLYNYALSNDFRFLSYGDSCLLEIKKT